MGCGQAAPALTTNDQLAGDRIRASITLEWTTRPEWLSSVTVNQQINHIAIDGVEDEKRLDGSVAPFFDNQKSTP
jgi:hypothetical protein